MTEITVVIPNDIEHSGNSDLECWAKLHGRTAEEVRAKGEAWINNWPQVYNPRYRIPPSLHPDGYWYCLVGRYHSCD